MISVYWNNQSVGACITSFKTCLEIPRCWEFRCHCFARKVNHFSENGPLCKYLTSSDMFELSRFFELTYFANWRQWFAAFHVVHKAIVTYCAEAILVIQVVWLVGRPIEVRQRRACCARDKRSFRRSVSAVYVYKSWWTVCNKFHVYLL